MIVIKVATPMCLTFIPANPRIILDILCLLINLIKYVKSVVHVHYTFCEAEFVACVYSLAFVPIFLLHCRMYPHKNELFLNAIFSMFFRGGIIFLKVLYGLYLTFILIFF